VFADSRARDAGFAAGEKLETYVVDGAARVASMVARASREPTEDWEACVALPAGAKTLVCRTAPRPGGFALVASMASAASSEAEGKLRHELEESSRGMRALYAELDEQADSLRLAGEVKTRFVANMSHELRTPLNSILGLSKLLLARLDGELTREQEKQIVFIRQSAESLSELVNHMLDLSKMDAGQMRVRTLSFTAEELFGSLRGMLRPIAARPEVSLVFDDVSGIPSLETDEGKVSQILRNFVTNALKFTLEGTVRVSARAGDDGLVHFSVSDTGIGIEPQDQKRIFEEFSQVDNDLQRTSKGTGLGLAVSRRIAALIAGSISVESEPGRGSTFTLSVPRLHPEAAEMARLAARSETLDPARAPVLVVEDDRQTLFLYEKYLEGSGFQVLPARTVEDAWRILSRVTPAAVVLDVMLEGETSWRFLSALKSSPETRDVPALVVTVMDREQKARALGADEFFVKPVDRDWLLRKLSVLASSGPVRKVLLIEDDEVQRYLTRRLLADTPYQLLEANDGMAGLQLARAERPDLILLDFVLPEMTALDVIDELKSDPRTRGIPVIVQTAKELDEEERRRLTEETSAVVSKQALSRELALSRIREALEKALPATTVATSR
jgi:signal transduction histidine kinase/CheY-like chemotaxis protein